VEECLSAVVEDARCIAVGQVALGHLPLVELDERLRVHLPEHRDLVEGAVDPEPGVALVEN